MTKEQIPVELLEVQNKLLIFRGDEFGEAFLHQIKDQLKRKGVEPLGIVLLPDYHVMTSAAKDETIQALKDVIKKLEAM